MLITRRLDQSVVLTPRDSRHSVSPKRAAKIFHLRPTTKGLAVSMLSAGSNDASEIGFRQQLTRLEWIAVLWPKFGSATKMNRIIEMLTEAIRKTDKGESKRGRFAEADGKAIKRRLSKAAKEAVKAMGKSASRRRSSQSVPGHSNYPACPGAIPV